MSTHLAASLHIPIAKSQKDEDANLLVCYAVSSVATVTKVSKNHSAIILTVRQSKKNQHPFTQQHSTSSHIICIFGNTAVRTSNLK
jgi:hypothetical protein